MMNSKSVRGFCLSEPTSRVWHKVLRWAVFVVAEDGSWQRQLADAFAWLLSLSCLSTAQVMVFLSDSVGDEAISKLWLYCTVGQRQKAGFSQCTLLCVMVSRQS